MGHILSPLCGWSNWELEPENNNKTERKQELSPPFYLVVEGFPQNDQRRRKEISANNEHVPFTAAAASSAVSTELESPRECHISLFTPKQHNDDGHHDDGEGNKTIKEICCSAMVL